MKTPVCCGRPTRRYIEIYDGRSVEIGFRCQGICRRIRIPYESPGPWHPFTPFTAEQHASYLENLRAEGYEIVA